MSIKHLYIYTYSLIPRPIHNVGTNSVWLSLDIIVQLCSGGLLGLLL